MKQLALSAFRVVSFPIGLSSKYCLLFHQVDVGNDVGIDVGVGVGVGDL